MRSLAVVWLAGQEDPYPVAQTAGEVQGMVDEAEDRGGRWIVLMFSGTVGPHDGKPLRVRASSVVAIGPPPADEDE